MHHDPQSSSRSHRLYQQKISAIWPVYGRHVEIPRFTGNNFKLQSEDPRCWTCKQSGSACDKAIPACHVCRTQNRACGGYGVRITWGEVGIPAECRTSSSRPISSLAIQQLSQLGLPSHQSFYLQHLSKNLARIALAVDYEGNGYRKWIQIAADDELLLDAILAVTIAHFSRWQRQQCPNESPKHHRRAIKQLRDRLEDPVLVQSETTLATILFLISYEVSHIRYTGLTPIPLTALLVFNGSNRWKQHHAGMLAWIRAFGSKTTLDPFLKSWVSMLNTQSALNTGIPVAPQVATWLGESSSERNSSVIDPFFGCSASLPPLMLQASQLYIESRTTSLVHEATRTRVLHLKEQLSTTKVDLKVAPVFEMTCAKRGDMLSPVHYFSHKEIFIRATAVAEIFRYSMLVYVLRILHPPGALLVPEIQEAVRSVLDLLPLVPDVLGPGSNLGWAYVVIGMELESEEEREYIWSRLQSLHSLALQNVASAEKVLKAGWRNRDEAQLGREKYRSWQDLMQTLDIEQILI